MEWQTIVACVLLIVIAVAIGFLLTRLRETKEKILAIVSLLAAVFLFVLTAFFSPLPPDYVSLYQPWLEVDLIVYSLQEETFRVAYEIRNIGKLPAGQLRLFHMNPMNQGFETSKFASRTIAPGSPIHYDLDTFRWKRQDLPPTPHFILAIDYSTQVGDTKHRFRAVFKHMLRVKELKDNRYQPSPDLKDGRYKPFSVNHEEGEFSKEELAKLGFDGLLGFSIPPRE